MYEKGKEKIEEYIVILNTVAYFLDYDAKNGNVLEYHQNGKLFDWDVSRKCSVDQLIAQYGLTLKPKNRIKEMKIVFDTLPSIKMKVPDQHSYDSRNDSIERTAQRFEIKFYFKDKNIYTSPITFLSYPYSHFENERNFGTYYKNIQQQIRQSFYQDYEFGTLFLEAENNFFLYLNIESTVFTGYSYYNMEGHEFTQSSSGSSPEAHFELLGKVP